MAIHTSQFLPLCKNAKYIRVGIYRINEQTKDLPEFIVDKIKFVNSIQVTKASHGKTVNLTVSFEESVDSPFRGVLCFSANKLSDNKNYGDWKLIQSGCNFTVENQIDIEHEFISGEPIYLQSDPKLIKEILKLSETVEEHDISSIVPVSKYASKLLSTMETELTKTLNYILKEPIKTIRTDNGVITQIAVFDDGSKSIRTRKTKENDWSKWLSI